MAVSQGNPYSGVGPSQQFATVSPSDTNYLPVVARAIYVGVAGNLAVVPYDDSNAPGAVVVFVGAAVGYHPISCKKVMATGTTATSIVALY